MRAMVLLTAGVLFFAPAGAGASEVSVRPAAPPSGRAIVRYAMENGLEVMLQEDHQLPLVTVSVLYDVGSADEPPGRSGLAHLCEHLMFRGSKHTRASHQGILSEVGAIHHNGSTSFHQTSYFETVPRGNLRTALWLESDRMGFLVDALDAEKLRSEREVVKNERRQLFDAAPYGLGEERLWQALFPAPHPYNGFVIGSMADLDRATLEDVRAFFGRYYGPGNATLALVGDFEPQAARQLVQKYFGTLPRRAAPVRREPPMLLLEREEMIRHRERVATLPEVVLAWHSAALGTPEDATAQVVATLLGASPASRLGRRLGGRAGLATTVRASQDSLRAQSVFKITAVGRPGADLQRIVREIDGALDEIRQGGVAADEVARAQLRLRTTGLIEMQDTANKVRRMHRAQAEEGPGRGTGGVPPPEPVTAADVVRFVRGVLAPGRRVVLYAEPDEKQALLR